ncbi:hypothetical protein JX265_003417 [Neoarthrinium moseri]|uniref:Uncharacterized protein n=1 Tax=Neoarthrinium moseri TaxID=1658444 RepID=A0A9P9WSF7_9PEZI|nr:hypothetical protein JX265_003417 [Neoarthrinium moseri]
MQPKSLLFGFIAAASAQSSSTSMDMGSVTVIASLATTSTLSPIPPVTIAPVSISTNPAVTANVSYTYYNTTVTTKVVVAELTTICATATTYTFNDCTYPATKGQTITVTNCPCTITKTFPTLTSSICPGSTGPAAPPTNNNAPVPPPPVNADSGSSGTTYNKPMMPTASPTGPVQVNSASGNAAAGMLAAMVFGLMGLAF